MSAKSQSRSHRRRARSRRAPCRDARRARRVFAVGRALLRAAVRAHAPQDPARDLPGRASVSAIVAATGATQTNVSRHLALMHQAGVVSRRREGSTVYYRVADPEFVEICRSVCVQIAGRIDERAAAAARAARVRRAALMHAHERDASASARTQSDAGAAHRTHPTRAGAPRSRAVPAPRGGCCGGGALAARASQRRRARTPARRQPAAQRARVEPHARRADPRVALRRAVEVRGERPAPRKPRPHAHAAVVGGVHAAAEPVRHHHAVGPALRAPSRRRARHRSAPAPADDPRPGRASRASTRWTTSCASRRCRASTSSSAARTPAWSGATSRCPPCSTRTACSAAASGPACRSSTLLDEVRHRPQARRSSCSPKAPTAPR